MYPIKQLEQDIRQLVLEEQGVYLKDRRAFKEFVCRFLVFLAKCTYKRQTHFYYYALDDATLCFSINKNDSNKINDVCRQVKDKMFQRREELVFCLLSEEERKKKCISPHGVSKTLHVPVYLAFVKCDNEKMVKASQDMCMFFFDLVHSKSAYAASKCSWTKRTPETHFVHVHTARATPNSSMRTTRTRGCNTWRTCTRRGLPYTLSPKRWGWISLLSTCCTWRPCLASNNLQKTPWPSRSSKSTRW